MKKSNVTPIQPSIKTNPVTLKELSAQLNDWRSAKKKQNEKIPMSFWREIFILLDIHSDTEVRSMLTLTPLQIKRASELYPHLLKTDNSTAPIQPIDFCSATQDTGANVALLNDTQEPADISEEDWFAQEIMEEKLYQAEVAKKQKDKTPLVYKPAKAFSTATSVVEIRRPDGMLMSIHICTDRFEELLRAFFKV